MLGMIPTRIPDDGHRYIKKIQPLYVNFNSGTTKDVAIEDVNPEYTIIKPMPRITNFPDVSAAAVDLLNKNTVRLTRDAADTSTLNIALLVIEFRRARSKQTGTTATSPVTIEKVDPTKCLIEVSVENSTTLNEHVGWYTFTARLTNETTLTFDLPSGSPTMHYQILELF